MESGDLRFGQETLSGITHLYNLALDSERTKAYVTHNSVSVKHCTRCLIRKHEVSHIHPLHSQVHLPRYAISAGSLSFSTVPTRPDSVLG